MTISEGDRLGFAAAGEPYLWVEVACVHEDGNVSLWFGRSVVTYTPGMIEQGLADGTIVKGERDAAGTG